jgi:tetratricopeptide (TPR) repeat protein
MRRRSLSDTFDVFLSHNSKDKPTVREIGEALRDRGLRVWLDEWELVPGRPWQEAIEEILATVLSSAVLVSKDGLGPWEIPEMRVCLSQMVKRRLPVIPVLLPGCPQAPELPLFLSEFTWVDLREGITDDRLDRLEWGITGNKPIREKKKLPPHGPKIHNLPFLPLGDLFKGRDDELNKLEANLQGPTTATAITQTQAISGLGGIGKTRLAVEYAWRSGDHYEATLFVVAESPEVLGTGLASLARLRLPGLVPSPTHAQEEEVAAVLSWLQEHDPWLLILDNVDSEEAAEAVREVLPQLQGGKVLITSRRRNWPAEIRRQPLDELSLEEATAFLLERTEGLRTSATDDPKHARRLAEILDGLPLALEHAAAYVVHHQMKLSKYLENWEKERENVLDWRDKDQTDYPSSVAATWQTTFRQLSPTAATILRLTAYLSPDPIPSEMFEKGSRFVEEGVRLLREETGQDAESSKPIHEGIAELLAYSMITRGDQTFTVHRMVQEVLRTRIPEERRREWIEWALWLVNDFSPFEANDVRTWPVWNVLRPHAVVVLRYADEAEIPRPTARLMNQIEEYLKAKGLYDEAEPFIRRALAIEEETKPDSADFATYLNNLAQLLKATNRLTEAEPLMRRALKIDEDSFGSEHPKVAIRLNNLASLLQATDRLAEAEPLMRQALKIDEDSFGSEHPNVAVRLNNLVSLLKATNRLAEAEPLMRRALKIDEDSFGSEHLKVAIDLNNLAQLLKVTNRLAEAELLMRRAVEIFEASLGTDHPKTQHVRRNLEILLAEMNPKDPQQG